MQNRSADFKILFTIQWYQKQLQIYLGKIINGNSLDAKVTWYRSDSPRHIYV